MSTITAVGPATTLDGPLPVPPLHSLLATPGVVVDELSAGEAVTQNGRRRWLNGVGLWGYPSGLPLAWEPCSVGTYRTKSEASTQPQPDFDPFGIYLPISCSSLGMPTGFAERAERVLEATQSFAVERALAGGVADSTNPFFGQTGMTILAGGAAVSASVGLRHLENAIGDTGRLGMIHLVPPVAVALAPFPFRRSLDPLRTTAGSVVVIGGGYADVDPGGAAAAPGPTQAWCYATGPVEVRLSEMVLVPEDLSDALDTANNDVVYRAERYVLATWDTALRAGVLVDWSL